MVPSNTIGTARAGIIVARKFCKNSKITNNTKIAASNRVITTPLIDNLISCVES